MFRPTPVRKQLHASGLTSFTAWKDRLTIWAAAALAGLAVVMFTRLTNLASDLFHSLYVRSNLFPLILTPAGGMIVVGLTRRYAAGSAGSGIPQVISALNASMPPGLVGRFVSLKLAVAKIVLGTAALCVGFSSGREGPSVQISASVMYAFRALFGNKRFIHANDLMLAGGAAGIAAAFNAPLAGVIFAIEELSRRFEQRSSGLIVSAIVLAGVVSVSLEGNFTYFGHLRISAMDLSILLPAVVCAVLAGILGGLFSRLLLVSMGGTAGRIHVFRRTRPVLFAGLCGLAVAVLGLVSNGAAHGSGYGYTQEMLNGTVHMPVLYVVVKFMATWFSFWSGIPGGLFAPSLAVGAGLGNDVALLFQISAVPLVAMGMVGFLAAATQAPITAFIIVMEMVDGHGMVLSLMACALLANMISKLLSPSLYGTLSAMQLRASGVEVQTPHT